MKRKISCLIVSVILFLSGKGFYDVYTVKKPPPIYNRNGGIFKNIVLPWKQALELTIVYKWTLFGDNSEFLNRKTEEYTKNVGIKWNRVIPIEDRAREIQAFSESNQILLKPWIWEKEIDQYETINEFFSRAYSADSDRHPKYLFREGDELTVHAPAESKIVAFRSVKESKKFWIKNKAFNIKNTGIPDWEDFQNHPMSICRMAPYDYHRFHAPVSGRVVHLSKCDNYERTWSHTVKPMLIQHPDFNVFNRNRRRFMVIETDFGKVALMIVGAISVDSITLAENIHIDAYVHKGDELGRFNFGGSTVVMFTDSDRLHFDDDILSASELKRELQVSCGEIIGRIH